MFCDEIQVRSSNRIEFIEITPKVQDLVARSGVRDGVCLLFVPHTTAAVTINENADPSVIADINDKLTEWAPPGARYRHTEGNADSHIKSALMGCSLMIPVKGGRLELGTWQGVFFCEFDGPRTRKILVRVF